MDHRFKCKIIKLVEENTGENLKDLGPGEEFLDMIPNTWPIREKKSINYTSSKVKNFALQKTLLKDKKTSHTLRENIWKHHKGLISRIYKELLKPNNKKNT